MASYRTCFTSDCDFSPCETRNGPRPSGRPFQTTAHRAFHKAHTELLKTQNVSANPNLGNPSVGKWFDTTVFSQPAIYTFGNEGVGIIRAGGTINTDLSVQRSFHIRERMKLQARGDFFNATNHTNFGLPNTSFGAPTFGQVTSAGNAREIEISMRLEF